MQNYNQKIRNILDNHSLNKKHRAAALALSAVVTVSVCGSLISPATATVEVETENSVYNDIHMLVGSGEGNAGIRGSTLSETVTKVNENYALGLASQFGVFVKGDFTPTGGYSEGRLAVGGNVDAAKYSAEDGGYKVGQGYYFGDKFYDLTNGKYGNSYACAIVGGSATEGLSVDVIKTYSELIDFEKAFEKLRGQSAEFAQNAENSDYTVSIDENSNTVKFVGSGADNTAGTVTFNVTAEDWQKISELENPTFEFTEIPKLEEAVKGWEVQDGELVEAAWESSYIIVNVEGSGTLSLPKTAVKTTVNGEDISGKLGAGSMLYNFEDVTVLELGGDLDGSILAPNADVTAENSGELFGALIAKSYEGDTKFGGYESTLPAGLTSAQETEETKSEETTEVKTEESEKTEEDTESKAEDSTESKAEEKTEAKVSETEETTESTDSKSEGTTSKVETKDNKDSSTAETKTTSKSTVKKTNRLKATKGANDSSATVNPGWFTIENILSNYQFFTSGDITANTDVVGSVAAGGDVSVETIGKAQISPLVVAGELKYTNYAFGQKSLPDGIVRDNTVYYGTLNGVAKDNFVQNSSYYNFPLAFEAIKQQSLNMSKSNDAYTCTTSDLEAHNYGWGSDYYVLNLDIDNYNNFVIPYSVYQQATVINFKGSNTSFDELIESGYNISITGVGDNNISINYNGDPFGDSYKYLRYNYVDRNNDGDIKHESLTTSHDREFYEKGTKLILNFPDATGTIKIDGLLGHIVAPNADVNTGSLTIEGGVIAKSATAGNECHFYPYDKSDTITPYDHNDPKKEDSTETSYTLPSTGGIGTTIYYVTGSATIILSVLVYLIVKRRERRYDKV